MRRQIVATISVLLLGAITVGIIAVSRFSDREDNSALAPTPHASSAPSPANIWWLLPQTPNSLNPGPPKQPK